jgi:hypothetical protein
VLQHGKASLTNKDGAVTNIAHKFYPFIPLAFVFNKFYLRVNIIDYKKCCKHGEEAGKKLKNLQRNYFYNFNN